MQHRQRHDPSKSLVGFSVGEVQYAVAIARVKEITNPMRLVELPHAPASVVGVADYRGEVVPVVDLRLRFGLSHSAATRKTKWIVVDVAGRTLALIVDAVTEVFGTGGADLRTPPSLGDGDDLRGIEGVTNFDGRLVFVLDIARFQSLTESFGSTAQIGPGVKISALPPERSA
ncbi:MAG: chemotaxis protein CheW [Polyangiaceae bacterium]|jgi:purine-binding chemotaxis protein CheW